MATGDLIWTGETRNGVRIAGAAGRVDEANAVAFLDRLNSEVDLASGDGVKRLVVDLSEIEYMSSRGLRGLTLAQRKAGEAGIAIVLARPNEIMVEILAISRYDKVFQVFESIEATIET